MQNAERERLIGQMTAAPRRRAAAIVKATVCVGAIALLVVAGLQAPDYAPAEAGSAAPSLTAARTDVRAETHRKQVFAARRQHTAQRDFETAGQDITRQARMAYVAP